MLAFPSCSLIPMQCEHSRVRLPVSGFLRVDFQSHFVCIFCSGTIADEWNGFDGPSVWVHEEQTRAERSTDEVEVEGGDVSENERL